MMKITEKDLITNLDQDNYEVTKICRIFAEMRLAQSFFNDAMMDKLSNKDFSDNVRLAQTFFDNTCKLIKEAI